MAVRRARSRRANSICAIVSVRDPRFDSFLADGTHNPLPTDIDRARLNVTSVIIAETGNRPFAKTGVGSILLLARRTRAGHHQRGGEIARGVGQKP